MAQWQLHEGEVSNGQKRGVGPSPEPQVVKIGRSHFSDRQVIIDEEVEVRACLNYAHCPIKEY